MFNHTGSLMFGVLAIVLFRDILNMALEDLGHVLGVQESTVSNTKSQIAVQYGVRIIIFFGSVITALIMW
ncbi:MAG: hypothetical protein WCO10_02125 [bacterium]